MKNNNIKKFHIQILLTDFIHFCSFFFKFFPMLKMIFIAYIISIFFGKEDSTTAFVYLIKSSSKDKKKSKQCEAHEICF